MFSKQNQKKLYSVLLFLAKFFLLSFVLHFLIWLNLDMTYVQIFIANSVYFILKIFGISVDLVANAFILKDASVVLIAEITRDCVAWKSILAFVCLIFATDNRKIKDHQNLRLNAANFQAFLLWHFYSLCTIKNKIKPILIGSAIIFFANIIRLATTFGFVINYGIKYFDFIHNILWQGGMVFLIIFLWYRLYLDKNKLLF